MSTEMFCWDCAYSLAAAEVEPDSTFAIKLRSITRLDDDDCCAELTEEGACCGHDVGAFDCYGCEQLIEPSLLIYRDSFEEERAYFMRVETSIKEGAR